MLNKFGAGLLLTITTLFLAVPSYAATPESRQKQISKYTHELQRLPNQGAPSSKVYSLVTKLAKLQPDHTTQNYALGLRKLGLPGDAGKEFALSLSKQLQKLVKKSDLSTNSMDQMVRRLNKIQRLYVAPTDTPQVSPSA